MEHGALFAYKEDAQRFADEHPGAILNRYSWEVQIEKMNIYWYIARLCFNGHTRMKVIFSSTYADYLPGDKIVKAFPRGDKISLKILKACGTEYPIEASKALRKNGECFPFRISDVDTI